MHNDIESECSVLLRNVVSQKDGVGTPFLNVMMQHPVLSPTKKALMNVNSRLREFYPDSEELFDIVLMTNNHAQVGVRLINSINHYGRLHPRPDFLNCIWDVTFQP